MPKDTINEERLGLSAAADLNSREPALPGMTLPPLAPHPDAIAVFESLEYLESYDGLDSVWAAFQEGRVPVVPDLDEKIYKIVSADNSRLEMISWHSVFSDDPAHYYQCENMAEMREAIGDAQDEGHACKTAHCLAGWAVFLGGEKGEALEKEYGAEVAGAMIYAVSEGHVPDFFDGDLSALDQLKDRAMTRRKAKE